METLELHPLCTLFPRIAGAEFEALKADILANGLRQPIVVLDGMILDGGNRYAACIAVDIDPDIVEFEGGSPVAFVLSSNLHRRHLSAGQQAAIVASAQDWTKAQAVGKPQLRNVAQLDTATTRAAQSGASHRTQQMADKVAKASPELARQVAHGEVSLPQAVKQISPVKAPSQNDAEMEDAFGVDPVAELEIAYKENNALHEQIVALSASDTGAELAKQVTRCQGIEARLALEMNKVNQLDKELRYFGKIAKELRDLLCVESNSKIVGAVRVALEHKAA